MFWAWLAAATVARGYLVFVLALAACALIPLLTGPTGSVIQSGSMQPAIDPGDVVLTMSLPEDAPLPLGRVITFEAPEGSGREGIVLHRLVAIDADGALVTAGDANAQPDSATLERDDIIAQALILVPFIGLPSFWITTGDLVPLTIWLLVTLLAVLIEGNGFFIRRGRHREVKAKIRRPASVRPASLRPALAAAVARTAGVVAAVAVTAALIVAPLFGQAQAAFSAKTQGVGSWSMAASGPAAKLAFVPGPSSSTGGTAFATQPVVVVQDAGGLTVTTSAAPITLTLTTPGAATLTCAANPLPATAGRATFTGCSVNRPGTYTLTARSGTLTAAVSINFVISVGPAAKLVFTTQPSTTVVSNVALAVQPRVTFQDAGGNTVSTTAAVTLGLTTPGAATLTCTTNPRSSVAGLATFAGCRVNLTGSYTFTATSGALTPAASSAFNVTPGAAAKLAFVASPSNSRYNTPFATQPVVVVQDASGNTVSSTAAVTLTITGTPSGPVLTCIANTKNAVAGTATFAGCRINWPSTYTLTARSGTLTAATSASFVITF